MRGQWERALWVACLLFGCQRVSERTLKDTEGRSFLAKCNREGKCELSRAEAAPVAADKVGVSLHAPGRVVAVCDVAAATPAETSDCRALVCRVDEDCPPNHGLPNGTCVNGLCTEPSNALNRDDAVLLCLAGTGLGRESPQQAERFALATNCGSPCVVPTPCRQP